MRRQEGAISLQQFHMLGFTDDEVKGLLRTRAIRRRHRGVYVDARTRETTRTKLFAALLACGDSAFLSHRTALALHGLAPLNHHAIEVTIVGGHTPRHTGLIMHRTSMQALDDEVRVLDDLHVASPTRALIDVAGRESPRELDRLLADMARRRALHLDRVGASMAHRPHTAGIAQLRAALQRYLPPAHDDASRLEHDVAAWLAAHPEIPTPLRNVRDESGYELDFFWPEHRLVVETDGEPYHLTPAELERDRIKDTDLQRRGLRVMRITGFRVDHDRSGILDDLRAFTKTARAA